MDSLRSFSIFIRLASAMIGFGATCLFIQFHLSPPPIGLPCDVVSTEGNLALYEENFAYLVNDKGSLLLASGGRHSTAPFSFLAFGIFKGLPTNSLMHAEFCNSRPVRLIANGIELFKLTQVRANENLDNGKTKSGEVALASFIACLLLTVLIGLIDKGLLYWYFF